MNSKSNGEKETENQNIDKKDDEKESNENHDDEAQVEDEFEVNNYDENSKWIKSAFCYVFFFILIS